MQELLRIVDRVAPTDSAVLDPRARAAPARSWWRGPSTSARRAREQAFVPIHCGALPREVLESELFGHEKGAFTGAVDSKPGLIELADGGTLFLDEIGEMEPESQVRLLRVLETALFFRVGGTRSRTVDMRLVAATNRDLAEAIRTGRVPPGPLLPHQHDHHRCCRRCASGPRTCALLAEHFVERNAAYGREAARPGDARAASRPTHGPATCASCSTPSSAR